MGANPTFVLATLTLPGVLFPRRFGIVSKMIFDWDTVFNTISAVSKRTLLVSWKMSDHSSMQKQVFVWNGCIFFDFRGFQDKDRFGAVLEGSGGRFSELFG